MKNENDRDLTNLNIEDDLDGDRSDTKIKSIREWPESKVEAWGRKELKKLGWLVPKMSALSSPGWPDRLHIPPACSVTESRVLFVEYKKSSGKLSEKQKIVALELNANGHPLFVIYGEHGVKEFIDRIKIQGWRVFLTNYNKPELVEVR